MKANYREKVLKEKLTEIYMKIADSFYYEGSDEETERKEYAPKFVNEITALIHQVERDTLEAEREKIETVFDDFRSSNQKIKGKRRFGVANFKIGARDLYDRLLMKEKGK